MKPRSWAQEVDWKPGPNPQRHAIQCTYTWQVNNQNQSQSMIYVLALFSKLKAWRSPAMPLTLDIVAELQLSYSVMGEREVRGGNERVGGVSYGMGVEGRYLSTYFSLLSFLLYLSTFLYLPSLFTSLSHPLLTISSFSLSLPNMRALFKMRNSFTSFRIFSTRSTFNCPAPEVLDTAGKITSIRS